MQYLVHHRHKWDSHFWSTLTVTWQPDTPLTPDLKTTAQSQRLYDLWWRMWASYVLLFSFESSWNEVNDLMKWIILNKLIISQQYIYEEIASFTTECQYLMWWQKRVYVILMSSLYTFLMKSPTKRYCFTVNLRATSDREGGAEF